MYNNLKAAIHSVVVRIIFLVFLFSFIVITVAFVAGIFTNQLWVTRVIIIVGISLSISYIIYLCDRWGM